MNQGNRLFAHGVADASFFIQTEVNQHTVGGSALNKIWQAPKKGLSAQLHVVYLCIVCEKKEKEKRGRHLCVIMWVCVVCVCVCVWIRQHVK